MINIIALSLIVLAVLLFVIMVRPNTKGVIKELMTVDGSRFHIKYKPMTGGYMVTVKELPEIITTGKTLDEARKMCENAIKLHLGIDD